MTVSFKDLKKKGSALSTLQKKIEETESTSFGTKDERIWTPEKDKAGNGYAIIRFLPAAADEEMPFVKLYTHGFQGPGGWYIENSLTTLGQTDPIGEYNRELWNSGEEELKNQVRKQKRKLNYYSNIYIVTDSANPENEGQVFLFRYGKKIFDKIMDAVNGDEMEGRKGFNPFDLWEGANFKLRVKQVEGYPNYDASSFMDPGVLEGLSDAQLESIWKREHSLEEIVAPDKFKTVEELQAQLDRALGRKGGASKPVEKTVDVASKPKFNVVSEPETVDSDETEVEEDNALDYFKQLAEA
jgi:hypothetical protein